MMLQKLRSRISEQCERVRDTGGPYGCYRQGIGQRPDLYASLDIAILRSAMGEDLSKTLAPEQRQEWIGHINSYAGPAGDYTDRFGQSRFHANGMVVGALSVLQGRQGYPVSLYDAFNSADLIAPWLQRIDWSNQWASSHDIWGGLLCYSLSRACSDEWRACLFDWLNRNLDEQTGWWRKGIPHADRHQPLGGSVHILPLYQRHRQPFPYPEKVIDSIIALQLPHGRWLQDQSPHMVSYLELNALYALRYMSSLCMPYRSRSILNTVKRYATLVQTYCSQHFEDLLTLHPHYWLAAVGTLGLLQQFFPGEFEDTQKWSDPFSDARFYQVMRVECLSV